MTTSPAPKIPTITVGLRPFDASPPVEGEPPAVSALLVTFSALPGGGARFSFTLEGRIAALRVPVAGAPASEPLWQHTCFEAFLSASGADSYREYNFSPAGLWATSRFQRYREAEADAPTLTSAPISFPILEPHQRDERLTLDVELPSALLPSGTLLRVGLAAVIEYADGHLDYWALRHPGAKPDFHLREGWTLVLDTQLVAQ
ncbi:hypothetical protein FACS1894154_06410 [Betaproteobacteria bacterium]|nr:hypothetical protein FACS1894154_06410 [Betaproteobacteria bacterium]